MSQINEPLGNLSPDLRAELDRIGRGWAGNPRASVERTVEIYTPLLAEATPSTATVHRDVAYGSHPRQVMDIHQPARRSDAMPPFDIVLFVHGGAFVRGDKCVNDQIYGNVCRWFADRGVLAVNVEYRLAGESPFPGGSRDVAAAVDHMVTHAESYGGNPTRIFLMGHSAGGTHVASYAYDHNIGANGRPLLSDAVRGVMLVSARLRADVRSTNHNAPAVRAYFGDDESRYDQVSPVSLAAGSRVPTLIAIAQYENPHLDLYGAELFYKLLDGVEGADGRLYGPMPRFVQMLGHNHISIVAHMNSGEETLGPRLMDFMQACTH